MAEQRYRVLIDGTEVANNMPLDMMLVLVEAAFEKYHQQAKIAGMTVSIIANPEED